jgi:SMI1/KNR4 family protein SUKH-1
MIMVVNGLKLPAAFVRLCQAITEGKLPHRWELKNGLDAYGHPWGATLEINPTLEGIMWNTNNLRAFYQEGRLQQFPEDDEEPGSPLDLSKMPGFVHDFTDVSQFVWFGKTPSGEDFCFDFRADPKEPCVLYWDDGYWRRVAPHFGAFIRLFKKPRDYKRMSDLEYVRWLEMTSRDRPGADPQLSLPGIEEKQEASE